MKDSFRCEECSTERKDKKKVNEGRENGGGLFLAFIKVKVGGREYHLLKRIVEPENIFVR